MRERWRLFILFACTCAASWLAMMVVHELGHAINAWLSGGRVARVVLHPLAFSRTDLAVNPHPLLVVWGGILWGSLLPLLLWASLARRRLAFLLRFWAGFCLIANGAYLGMGPVMPVGDAEEMLRLGVPRWAMVCVGGPMIGAGLALWHGLGTRFGIGGRVDRVALVAASAACPLLAAAMLAWSTWTG